jgi:hypothetical protein
MADGWAVQVTTLVMGGGEDKQTYFAHVLDRREAERAVSKYMNAGPDTKVEAVHDVKHGVFIEMGTPEGGVRQWKGP